MSLAGAITDTDVVVVGGGIMGVCVARDLASAGHSIHLIEKEAELGGIWRLNNYPGLELQGMGAAWRCASLAPAYHASGDHPAKSLYKPTVRDTLNYIEEMAKHGNIIPVLNTAYTGVESRTADGKHVVGLSDGRRLRAKAVVLATGYDPNRTGKPYTPINVADVTNGATVVHSADLTADHIKKASRIIVVGSHKAAIEVMTTLDESSNVLWAHRGHYVFLRADKSDEMASTGTELSWISAQMQKLPAWLIYTGRFGLGERMMMHAGLGIQVGKPVTANKCSFHGGVVRCADVEHARKFEQEIISGITVRNGELHLSERTVAEPDDLVVLCTGQRNGLTADVWLEQAISHSSDGLFMALPYSIQACAAAFYTTKLVLDHLDGKADSFYASGGLKQALERISDNTRTRFADDDSVWSKTMSISSGMQLVAGRILPSVRGDLANSYMWQSSVWYGRDLDVKTLADRLGKPDSRSHWTALSAVAASGVVIAAGVAWYIMQT